MLLNSVLVLIGCCALYRGGDWLIDGVKNIGSDLGWSPALIGLLLVSVGTSAPELFVSLGAAMQGYGDIAVGNAIGSNIVNLSLVLGIGALIIALPIHADMTRRYIPVMLLLTAIVVVLLLDGHVSRPEALVLMVAAALGLFWAIRGAQRSIDQPLEDAHEQSRGLAGDLGRTALGVIALAIGAEALIVGGSGLASGFGVSEAVIALTVTSIGTGLPEIVATVLAVSRKEIDMAIANVVGSNIMNLGLVLGVSGVIVPLQADGIGRDTLLYLAAASLVLLLLGLRPQRVPRWTGALLLVSYGVYVLVLVGS